MDEQTLTASRPGAGMVVAVKKLKPEGFQGHKEWLVGHKAITLLNGSNCPLTFLEMFLSTDGSIHYLISDRSGLSWTASSSKSGQTDRVLLRG